MQPITTKNEFFDPAPYEYEILGFVEEFVKFAPERAFEFEYIGSRRLPAGELPARPIGSPGRIIVTFTETMILQRGHKTVMVKATAQKPIKCYAMIQPICGERKQHINPLHR